MVPKQILFLMEYSVVPVLIYMLFSDLLFDRTDDLKRELNFDVTILLTYIGNYGTKYFPLKLLLLLICISKKNVKISVFNGKNLIEI